MLPAIQVSVRLLPLPVSTGLSSSFYTCFNNIQMQLTPSMHSIVDSNKDVASSIFGIYCESTRISLWYFQFFCPRDSFLKPSRAGWYAGVVHSFTTRLPLKERKKKSRIALAAIKLLLFNEFAMCFDAWRQNEIRDPEGAFRLQTTGWDYWQEWEKWPMHKWVCFFSISNSL